MSFFIFIYGVIFFFEDSGISDPVKLMQDMRNDGFALKQNALGRVLNRDDPNQVIIIVLICPYMSRKKYSSG